jgi:hypothetical protein
LKITHKQVVITHHITVDAVASDGSSTSTARERSRELNFPPALLFADVGATKWALPADLPGIQAALPPNVELTTLELSTTGVLVRFTHIYPPGEHPTLSTAASVDLTAAMPRLASKVTAMTEMWSSADAKLTDVTRLTWNVIGEEPSPATSSVRGATMAAIVVNPGETRTFELTMSSSQ